MGAAAIFIIRRVIQSRYAICHVEVGIGTAEKMPPEISPAGKIACTDIKIASYKIPVDSRIADRQIIAARSESYVPALAVPCKNTKAFRELMIAVRRAV